MRHLAIFLQCMFANSILYKTKNFPQLLRAFSQKSENAGSKRRQKNTETIQNWHREPQVYLQLLLSVIKTVILIIK